MILSLSVKKFSFFIFWSSCWPWFPWNLALLYFYLLHLPLSPSPDLPLDFALHPSLVISLALVICSLDFRQGGCVYVVLLARCRNLYPSPFLICLLSIHDQALSCCNFLLFQLVDIDNVCCSSVILLLIHHVVLDNFDWFFSVVSGIIEFSWVPSQKLC